MSYLLQRIRGIAQPRFRAIKVEPEAHRQRLELHTAAD